MRLLLTVLLTLVAAFPARGQQSQDTTGRRIEILFLGHESRHHPSDSAAAYLVPALAREGFNFQYTTDPNDLNRENLAKFDALILYANHDSITPSQEAALLEFVESGNGFLPIHSASYCFRNSDRVVAMMGGQFASHGTGTFTVDITRPDNPVMQGLTPFETWDETYVHTKHNPENRTVLMERVDGDTREPWTWVRTQGDGRVFYTAYGHDGRTWRQPAFHALIRNGILWAVGDEVRAQWEALDIPELQYSETSWIPNYERRNPPLKYQEPLSPAESMLHIQVPPGFELQLFAAEPDIAKPIAMVWDERGRLWIAETVDYPNDIHPGEPGNDRIKILEDTDGDGRADKFTVFAYGLNVPTALTFASGGLVVAHMPDLILLKDTNGDDRADSREVLATGFGFRDTHAGPSNLRYGFDNWIWGAVGYSSFQGVVGGDSLQFGQAIYRIRGDGSKMEHVANFSNNTWGLGFSETFDTFGSTANNTHAVYVGIPKRYSKDAKGVPPRFGADKIDGHYAMAAITPNVRQVDVFGGFTAAAGFEVYTARNYPREYWNRIALVSEPTGGVLHRAILERDGAGFVEKDGWNLLAATDEWVGPVDARVGPDGQVWVADWYNFIIQHNPTPPGFDNGEGNAYVNPLRDKEHGRIYRIVYKGDAVASTRTGASGVSGDSNAADEVSDGAAWPVPMSLSADDPDGLVRALEHDNLFWRLTAQRLLVERGNTDVAPKLITLTGSTRSDALGLSPGPLHALWTLHGLGLLDGSNAAATQAAVAALRHPVPAVRKAAAQVLPADDALLGRLQDAGLLEDADANTRKAALLRLNEMPESDELGARLYAMSTSPEVLADKWLGDAVYVASAHHRTGFLGAYETALGGAEYRALADRLAADEAAPRQFDLSTREGWEASEAAAAAAAARPPAERLLRAYLDEVVGPIERGTRTGRFGNAPSDDPVLEITVSALPGQLKFDVTEFTVKPRQRVRLTLMNPDAMQHNLLLIRPGTTEAVGALADALLATPDAADRGYIPPTPDVIRYTELVEPGESAVLEFTAPREEGDYPYICTFPGHWRLMQGKMFVKDEG
jgi:putative membrane-bound dehydrogenase-like protein